jgi:hypothetical protein
MSAESQAMLDDFTVLELRLPSAGRRSSQGEACSGADDTCVVPYEHDRSVEQRLGELPQAAWITSFLISTR